MASPRPSTPTPQDSTSKTALTPEQVKRIEISRLKAKGRRDEFEAQLRQQSQNPSRNNLAAGQKRAYAAISSNVPRTLRDAQGKDGDSPKSLAASKPLDSIQPARNFAKFVEYDFSKMTDTKGGFMTVEDDPHNKALHAPGADEQGKPAHMTLKEWERHQLLKKLREQHAGPFEPGLSVLQAGGGGGGAAAATTTTTVCRECGGLEVDWTWATVLRCAVCHACKDRFPDRYSLLTKTEARADYLLTEPELQDAELLPHIERPNPHKATWNNMMLYLRYQVEEYAFDKKWGSAEALDEAFATREAERRRRKQERFKGKLEELKKRTRVEAWRRKRRGEDGGAFGDAVGGGRHAHEWGRVVVEGEEGIGVKTCVGCGMEVEELEF